MIPVRTRFRSVAGTALLGALSATACETDNVTDITDVPGVDEEVRPVLKMLIAPGDAVFPSGSVALSKAVVSGFDLSVPDGFDRATGPADLFRSVETGSGTASAVDVGASVRNSSQDPRLPELTESSAAVGGHFGLFELNPITSNSHPVGRWDLWGELQGLEPSTVYTIVLARMALEVNGELDQNQVLTGAPVDRPDALSFLPGEETLYSNVNCNYSAVVRVTAAMNPVTLGFVETDAEGNAAVDCIVDADPAEMWPVPAAGAEAATAADFTASNAPFGSNEPGATVGPGQFNYLLLHEGEPAEGVSSGSPAVRMQLGPDVDADGNVVNNAMAPFPTGTVPNAPQLSGGANSFAAPGRIDVTLSGFSPLSGGSYQLWLHDAGSGSYAAAAASMHPAEDMEMTTTGSTFSPASAEDVYHARLELSMDQDLSAFTHVAVSAESGEAGSPTGGPFLYQEYLSSDNLMQQGAMTFGRLGPDGGIEAFSPGGSGSASFYRNSLLVDLNRLPTPPPGLHYRSYLAAVSPTGVGSSAQGNAIALDARGNATDRLEAAQVGDFASFTHYLLVLEPDGLSSFTRMWVQQSDDYRNKFKEFFGG